MAAEPNQPAPEIERDDLLRVCRLLQKHRVKYVMVGGCACGLHGLIRSTQDVDLLVETSPENLQLVIDALSELPDHAARELTVKDLQDNVVVKIADEVMVDVAKQAWTVRYEDALHDVQKLTVNGVDIIYAGLDTLLQSKSTHREQDQIDRRELLWIKQSKQKP